VSGLWGDAFGFDRCDGFVDVDWNRRHGLVVVGRQ
jgi:hypothetical protein